MFTWKTGDQRRRSRIEPQTQQCLKENKKTKKAMGKKIREKGEVERVELLNSTGREKSGQEGQMENEYVFSQHNLVDTKQGRVFQQCLWYFYLFHFSYFWANF